MLVYLLAIEYEIVSGYCKITSSSFSTAFEAEAEVFYDFLPLDVTCGLDDDLGRKMYIFDEIPLSNAMIERHYLVPGYEIRCIRWGANNVYHYEPIDIDVI